MYKQRTTPRFLVWTPATRYTRKKHKTAEAAVTEAQRLANLNPTFKYHVLMAIGHCEADSDA